MSDLVASIFNAAFHITIFGGTLVHAVGLRRFQRDTMPYGVRSLTQLFIRQGVVWFFIVFSCNISTIIWNEVMHPDLRNATVASDTAVSLILVCRFFLSLRRFNSRSNTTSGQVESVSTMAFRATVGRIRNGILQDIGDPEYDEEYFANDVHPAACEHQNEDSIRRVSENTTTITALRDIIVVDQ